MSKNSKKYNKKNDNENLVVTAANQAETIVGAAEQIEEAVSDVIDKANNEPGPAEPTEGKESSEQNESAVQQAAVIIDAAKEKTESSIQETAADKQAEAEAPSDDSLMERWYKASQKRVSIRKYCGTPEVSVLRELRQIAQMVSTEDARIYVGKREGIFNPVIGKTITGTEAFAAVILRSKNKYMAGFVGEAFLLECASRGLGTCWLGLSYKKAVAKAAVKLRENERIVCVIAIGKYNEMPETVGARKSIFNLTGMEDDSFYALPEWQQCAVRCARLAPSARNAQPWEFDIMPDSIQVSITSGNMGYGEIDCGIAMLHIELGAAHCGLIGDWIFDEGYPIFRISRE